MKVGTSPGLRTQASGQQQEPASAPVLCASLHWRFHSLVFHEDVVLRLEAVISRVETGEDGEPIVKSGTS